MTLPYRSRITTLINNEWVELVRFKRACCPHHIAFYTRGLSGPWQVERPLHDKQCLTSRPKLVALT